MGVAFISVKKKTKKVNKVSVYNKHVRVKEMFKYLRAILRNRYDKFVTKY